MSASAGIPIELVDAFGAGVYLLFGALHFDLWLRRRERRSHLWLACTSAAALLVDLTGMMLRVTGEVAPLVMLNLAGVAIATGSIVELIGAIARKSWPRIVHAGILGAIVLAPLAVVVPAAGVLLLVLCFVLLFTAAIRAATAGRRGDRESRATAVGVLVLIASLLADLAMELTLLPRVAGLPVIGFTFLFVVTAWALNGRYEREHHELVELRRELEVRVQQRTEELVDANRRLAEASRTDALTGLANRRGVLEAAAQEVAHASRSARPCSVIIADLDHFKSINDARGHAAGDAVLRDAAAVIRRAVRAQDIVGRWGGEEFILLLPDTDAEGAVHAAETIRRAVAERAFVGGAETISLTVSLGVAEHRPGTSLETTIAAADAALYRAKAEGRNRVIA